MASVISGAGGGPLFAFERLEKRLSTTTGDSEYLLEEQVVRNLNNRAAILAQDREDEVAVDDAAFQVFGKNFYSVAEIEGVPKRNEEACGKVAYDRPGRQKTDADDGRGADQKRPQSSEPNAPDVQQQQRRQQPERAGGDARDGQGDLVAQMKPRLDGLQPIPQQSIQPKNDNRRRNQQNSGRKYRQSTDIASIEPGNNLIHKRFAELFIDQHQRALTVPSPQFEP